MVFGRSIVVASVVGLTTEQQSIVAFTEAELSRHAPAERMKMEAAILVVAMWKWPRESMTFTDLFKQKWKSELTPEILRVIGTAGLGGAAADQ